jgi:hypothetical protein
MQACFLGVMVWLFLHPELEILAWIYSYLVMPGKLLQRDTYSAMAGDAGGVLHDRSWRLGCGSDGKVLGGDVIKMILLQVLE